jgi:NAD(P)-dependent dehydrogenase (short-subunit alcohol dehydrogenase family)
VTDALFRRVIDVNLIGTFHGMKHALPALLRAGGGTIVNNSSVSAFANVGGNISYAASKGAVMSMTRVVAIEFARRNIRCNAINPGVIDTGMNRRNAALADDPAALERRWSEITPMGRMGTGDEIAEAVLFLATPASSFITGVGLLVDGGRVAT